MAPVHYGSPPPRKRIMLASQAAGQGVGVFAEAMAAIRHQSVFDVFDQCYLQSGRQRRHHSDPGAHVKMQRSAAHGFLSPVQQQSTAASATPQACVAIPMPAADHHQQQHSHLIKPHSKRERTSNSGDAGGGSGGPSAGFKITVDCRADSSATVLLQRMHQLELRNKELEQQLVEQMQAAQISSSCQASSSRHNTRPGHQSKQQQQQQLDPGSSRAPVSPRAHAVLPAGEASMAMECEAASSQLHRSVVQQPGVSLTVRPQQQQQQDSTVIAICQQQQQLLVPDDDAQLPHQGLVHGLTQQVQGLQKELQRQQQLNTMLTSDNADLETVLKETERQRREFAARYAFMTLDTDGDGYVSVEQVLSYDLFSCYAPCVLLTAFNVWRWDSGFVGYLCMDDFVRFVEFAEDRSTRESQRFWFMVMDADGDGRLSWADMKLLYDAVRSSRAGSPLLHFHDLMCQIADMVAQQRDTQQGFTAQELWESKLGAGVIGLLTNANNMLLQRSTAEWGRGDFPL